MAREPDPFMTDEENPERTPEATTEAKTFGEIFPAQRATWKRRGRPPVAAPKVHIGFRLAADVIEAVRASGPGYNARVENVLRDALAKGLL